MFKNIFTKFALIAFFAVPFLVSAQMSDTEKLIIQLQDQIQNILQKIADFKQQSSENYNQDFCYIFNKNLKNGSFGSDVFTLQKALGKEGFLSADDITGYFGQKTNQAVVKFQEKYALEILIPNNLDRGTGFVGERTIKKLNQLYECVKDSHLSSSFNITTTTTAKVNTSNDDAFQTSNKFFSNTSVDPGFIVGSGTSVDYWFSPLPPLQTSKNRPYVGSNDFINLFKSDSPWQTAASRIKVFKFYGEWLLYGNATDDELRQVVADLKRRGIALAVEAGPLMPDPVNGCGTGIEGFSGSQWDTFITRIKAAGGIIDYVDMDEPFYYAHVYDGPGACHWSADKIAQEIKLFVVSIRKHFPNVIIGDTEPIVSGEAPLFKEWLDAFKRVNGFPLSHLHLDVQWETTNWPQLAKSIENISKQSGVEFGIIYNAASESTDLDWISTAGEHVKTYELDNGGNPDHVVFQSWNDKPDYVLPENNKFTFTNFINAYFENKKNLGYSACLNYFFSHDRNTLIVGKDSWTFSLVCGKVGDKLSVAASKDGVSLGNFDVCVVKNSNSGCSISSIPKEADVGRWEEIVYINGIKMGTITFNVITSSACLNYYFSHNGGTLVAGKDAWTFSLVCGKVGDKLSVAASKDGVSLGNFDVCVVENPNSSCSISSIPQKKDIGNWSEKIFINGIEKGAINFMVVDLPLPTTFSDENLITSINIGGPSSAVVGATTFYTFSATSNTTNNLIYVIDWSGGNAQHIVANGTNKSLGISWSSTGQKIIQFRAINQNNTNVFKNTYLTVNVTSSSGLANNVSDPTMTPLMVTQGIATNFIVSAVENSGGKVKYNIQWGDGTYDNNYGPVSNGLNVPHIYNEQGQYNAQVLVYGYNSTGTLSLGSFNSGYFTVVVSAPSTTSKSNETQISSQGPTFNFSPNGGSIVAGRDSWYFSFSGAQSGDTLSVTASKDGILIGNFDVCIVGYFRSGCEVSAVPQSGDVGKWHEDVFINGNKSGEIDFEVIPNTSSLINKNFASAIYAIMETLGLISDKLEKLK